MQPKLVRFERGECESSVYHNTALSVERIVSPAFRLPWVIFLGPSFTTNGSKLKANDCLSVVFVRVPANSAFVWRGWTNSGIS